MTTSKNVEDKIKPKSYKLLLICLAAVACLIAILAFVALPFLSDGTDQFTGKEKEVAKLAIYRTRTNHPTSPLPEFTRQVRVMDVRSVTCEEDPGTPYHYVVTMQIKDGPLGTPRTEERTGCDFRTWDQGLWIKSAL